jgi:hypothetical protein
MMTCTTAGAGCGLRTPAARPQCDGRKEGRDDSKGVETVMMRALAMVVESRDSWGVIVLTVSLTSADAGCRVR